MESQDGGASSSSSSSHHAKTSSNKLKHHHHHQYFQPTQFPPTDPSAVTPPPSSSIRPPHFLPHQNHRPNSHDRSYRPHRSPDFLPGNSYPHANRSYTNNNSRYTNFGGGLGLNHQNHNHNVNLYASSSSSSSSSQFELQHTNSYNGYNNDRVQYKANQQFEWQLRSNSPTVGNFDNGQQYVRGDGTQWRGGNSSSGNIRRNFHQNVTSNGHLQEPGLTDHLDPVKAVQDHMNMSMKSVHENKVQKYVDKKKAQQSYKKLGVSGQLDIPRPGIRSNLCSVQPHCTVGSLLNLQVKDDKIANKDGSDKKAKMPTGNCGYSDTKEGRRFGATMQKEKDKCGAIDKKKGQRFSEKKLRVSRQLPHSGPVIGCHHDTGKAPGIKQSLLNLLVEDDKSAIELASDKEDYMPMGVWKHNHKKNGCRCEEKNSERGPLPLSNIHSVTASGVEESLLNLQAEIEEMAIEHGYYFDHNEKSKVPKHFYKKKSPRVYDEMFGVSSCPEPVLGIDPLSVKPTCTEESFLNLHAENAQIANQQRYNKQDQMKKDNHKSNITNEKKKGQNLHDEVQMNKNSAASNGTNVKKKDQKSHQKKGVKEPRKKYIRTDARGMGLLSQDVRKSLSQMICRGDIDMLITPFLATYESLIPAEEEKSKQKQLYTLIERLVGKQWPEAHLYLYGSSANSFAASMSDIDVCLRLDDPEINKSNILLRLADILQSDNFQNVKALPLTRVPVVKFMDPLTGISCDLCMNNVLSVENTKLLRNYAEIDVRLRQLVFIVKHWAKSRGVNETYEGTLSSYAYALMCIHFLQQRKPAILPCLQEMEITYSVTVDGFQCAYFDQVEELRCFGSNNNENIAELVWAFFAYWAYCHDYNNTVISVRTGGIISKQSKQWTTNIGKDRHFISIEDPFETTHDLGRVINRFTLKVMRVEFERAAHIMQWDPNACVNLFEPYVADGPLRRA